MIGICRQGYVFVVAIWQLCSLKPVSRLLELAIVKNSADFCQQWSAKIWPISSTTMPKFWDPPGSYGARGLKIVAKSFRATGVKTILLVISSDPSGF